MMDNALASIFRFLSTGKWARMLLAVAVFASPQVILLAQHKTTEAHRYSYDKGGVQLEGTLTERTVYGPPGFGETPAKDIRERILILKLAHPITVEPLADAKAKNSPSLDTARNVRDVQLFVGRTQTAEAHKLIGTKIVAIGTLNEAVAPSQYTKVWMDVKSFSPK